MADYRGHDRPVGRGQVAGGYHSRASVVACLRLAVFPAIAVVLFLVNSRWTVGAWFVSGGFFVPENTKALGHPLVAYQQVSEGLHQLSGTALVWSAYAGAILTTVAFARSVSRASLIVLLALAAAAALPWMAYLQGHPFRIRYDVPLVAAPRRWPVPASDCCGDGRNHLSRLPWSVLRCCRHIHWTGPHR